jgi:hypothetical protein
MAAKKSQVCAGVLIHPKFSECYLVSRNDLGLKLSIEAKDFATHRQSVWLEIVSYVIGAKCYP